MVLKDILAISGEPGLFRFIAQGKNSIIVEHLETKKRSSSFSSGKVSLLDDIAVYTEKEDMPLSKVFDIIFDSSDGNPVIDGKSDGAQMKKWFETVLPEYDKDRVYVSDIKKIAQWYNTLHALNMLEKEKTEEKEEASETAMPEKQEEKPAKQKKKTSSPKSKKK